LDISPRELSSVSRDIA